MGTRGARWGAVDSEGGRTAPGVIVPGWGVGGSGVGSDAGGGVGAAVVVVVGAGSAEGVAGAWDVVPGAIASTIATAVSCAADAISVTVSTMPAMLPVLLFAGAAGCSVVSGSCVSDCVCSCAGSGRDGAL